MSVGGNWRRDQEGEVQSLGSLIVLRWSGASPHLVFQAMEYVVKQLSREMRRSYDDMEM